MVKSDTLLTDKAVADRLATYGNDDRFGVNLQSLWSDAGDAMLEATRIHWETVVALPHNRDLSMVEKREMIACATEEMRFKLSAPFDAAWIRKVGTLGEAVYRTKVPSHMVAIGLFRHTELLLQALEPLFLDDPARRERHRSTVSKLGIIELELLLTQVRLLDRKRAADERGAQGERFRNDVAQRLQTALEDSTRLRNQSGAASATTHKMRSAVVEVTVSAERSAVVMSQAARTAGNLTDAIGEIQLEVTGAAEIATRAARSSKSALEISKSLSQHAMAVESVVGLIRAIAKQTNLLALNATIEAARAGEAGRGFAVVAQEVKSLANQTAHATEDIAAQISAIQDATQRTVEANGSIHSAVGAIEAQARRILEAMEAQGRAASTILSAVNETAASADFMANTISVVRRQTDEVEQDVGAVVESSRELDGDLAVLKELTTEFVARVAA